MDLNECKDIKIHHFIKVDINESELYKYDINGDYFNDKCSSFSENGVDKTMFDRKKEFNDNSMSLCEKDCNFNGYNTTNKRVDCECQIKESLVSFYNMTLNTDSLINKFKNIKNWINIGIIKCYKLLLLLNGYIKNFGSYIFLLFLLVNLILIFVFYFKDYKIFKKEIFQLFFKMLKQYKRKKTKTKINKDIKIKNKKNKSKLHGNNLRIFRLSNPIKPKLYKNEKLNKSENYNLNEYKIGKTNIQKSELELNSLDYKGALKFDRRTYAQYYCSLLKESQLFLFAFIRKNDYNSRIIKICLFISDIALSFTVNALFFNDSTMHKIYVDEGRYNFLYQIPQVLFSSLISIAINNLLVFISLTEKDVLKIKSKRLQFSVVKVRNKFIKLVWIKFMIFHILNTLFMIIFWFYISLFCAVYHNTQIQLITNTLISYATSNIYPFIIDIFPAMFRILALKSKGKRPLMYKFSLLLSML